MTAHQPSGRLAGALIGGTAGIEHGRQPLRAALETGVTPSFIGEERPHVRVFPRREESNSSNGTTS